jgi:hypothetical protein
MGAKDERGWAKTVVREMMFSKPDPRKPKFFS